MPPTQTQQNSNQSPPDTEGRSPIAKLSKEDEQQEIHERDSGELEKALTVGEALALYNSSKEYINRGFRKLWDNCFKVYKGVRVIRNYEGISDISIRESHTIIETLVANIAGNLPEFQFIRTHEEQAEDVEVLNAMTEYYMLCNHMGLKNQEWVREMLLYGSAILGADYRDGKPFIFNIPLRDFFVDPTSTGLVDTLNPAEYAGYEYLANKSSLRRKQIYDAELGRWVNKYHNLDNIGKPDTKSGTQEGREMDKAFKDMFIGSTIGDKAIEDQVHVIKLHHLPSGRIYEIGNKKEFIYNKPTWCQREEKNKIIEVEVNGEIQEAQVVLSEIKPFLPFAVLRCYIDSSLFYGSGMMELILPDAELLNDYENMEIDNNAYQNTPMFWIDPRYADLASTIETIPGAVYPIPRNAMGVIELAQITSDLSNKQERVLQRMRRYTAADEVIQGGAIGNSRTTATEVNTQVQQAQLRFATFLTNIESEGYAQLASLILKIMQVFTTTKTAIRIIGKKGVEFKDFDPWDYDGEFEVNAQLSTTIKNKEIEVGLKDNSIFEALKDTEGIDQIELGRWWTQKKDPTFTDDKFNKLLLPPAPPVENEREYLNIDYKDATPYTKYQMEKKLGLEPDPAHLGDMENKMLEQANVGADFQEPTTTADNQTLSDFMPQKPAPATSPI